MKIFIIAFAIYLIGCILAYGRIFAEFYSIEKAILGTQSRISRNRVLDKRVIWIIFMSWLGFLSLSFMWAIERDGIDFLRFTYGKGDELERDSEGNTSEPF